MDTKNITRVELIDDTGRRIVLHSDRTPFTLYVQDAGETLKVVVLGTVEAQKPRQEGA